MSALSQITVKCGQLTVEGYQKCDIAHDGDILSYKGPRKITFLGYRFGLITFNCDDYAGYLISHFCSHDEFEESCKSGIVTFYAAIITAIFLTSLFWVIFVYCMRKGLLSKFLNFGYYRQKKNSFEPSTNTPTMTNLGGANYKMYAENGETVESSGQENCIAGKESLAETKEEHCTTGSSGKKSLVTVISGLLFIKSVSACDLTLHMNFNGFTTVCVGTDCQNTALHTMSLTLGQQICFEDEFGGLIKLNISEINVRSRYELMYYTSDYRVSLSSEGECLGRDLSLGLSVLPHDVCGAANRLCNHDKLAALNLDQGKNSKTFHQESTCEIGGKQSFNQYSSTFYYPCCRYTWQVESVGKLYPVYSRVGQIWSAKFTASQNNATQEVEMDAFDPTRNLEGFKLSSNETITFTVLDVHVNTSSRSNALILYNDVFYIINASELYRPQAKTFGDIQVPLKKAKLIFDPPKHGVCEYQTEVRLLTSEDYDQNCTCQCTLPDGKIKSFLDHAENFESMKNYLFRSNDSSIIDAFENEKEGAVKIKMGEWNLNDSTAKRAKCDIQYVMSNGCISCNSSYIVLTPRNIDIEGIVPFYSNCSFDKHYLKCDLVEALRLVLRGNYRTCYLRMPTLNKSMIITIDYKDVNNLLESKGTKESAATNGDGFEPCTKTGVVITVALCSMFGLILSIIFTCHTFMQRKRVTEYEFETRLVQI